MAETRDLTTIAETQGARQTGIATGWQDVETWATALITFEDGSVSVAYGSDNVLGGMQSWLELFLSNSRIRCNIAPPRFGGNSTRRARRCSRTPT